MNNRIPDGAEMSFDLGSVSEGKCKNKSIVSGGVEFSIEAGRKGDKFSDYFPAMGNPTEQLDNLIRRAITERIMPDELFLKSIKDGTISVEEIVFLAFLEFMEPFKEMGNILDSAAKKEDKE